MNENLTNLFASLFKIKADTEQGFNKIREKAFFFSLIQIQKQYF